MILEVNINTIVTLLNSFPIELMWVIQIIVCYIMLLVMLRLFGFAGLYVFIATMIIAANIEVLKVVQFRMFAYPIALGTVFYAAIFWATDILTEYYNAKIARRGILCGFAGAVLLIAAITLCLGFRPLADMNISRFYLQDQTLQSSLFNIFGPMTRILAASLVSYLISQFTDVWIFTFIRKLTGRRFLWLRANLSTILSALLDNIIFNVLAWEIFTAHPMSWHNMFYIYFVPTYLIRIFIAVLGTPVIYLARIAIPKKSRLVWEKLK